MKEHAALLGFGNDLQSYENKFSGVAQLFFNQAGTARNQVQQNVLLLASNDAIINTAKSVGLDPSAVAWNTAIAEQQFQASMQAQGRMAQTFLPLAKAYLTAIVVGLSWLVALLSIIFANYAYIKMFFTLLLWLTLWTPIIAIINYLNDLNLMKVAQVITEGKTALTMGTNMLIYKKIADNASFMNYLVMSTPVLAYALAKASEQGFVTFASGLSQALQGSSRAAGTFANQQALSTKSEISSPRGDEVYALNAGVMSLQSAFSASGAKFSDKIIAGGAQSITDANTGSSTTLNSDGTVGATSVKGLNSNMLASNQMSRQKGVSEAIQNSDVSQRALELSSGQVKNYGVSSADADAIAKASQHALATAYAKATGVDVGQAYDDVARGGLLIGGTGGSTGSLESEKWYQNLSKAQKEDFHKTFNETISNTITTNDTTAAAFSNLLKTSDIKNSAQILSSMDSYSEAKSLSAAVGFDGGASLITNYVNENYGGNFTKENVASAMKNIENMASRGDLKGLSHYAGVDSNVNSDGLSEQSKQNYYDPKGGLFNYNKNREEVDSAAKFLNATRNAPQDNSGSTVSGEAARAAEATESILKNATKGRDEKIGQGGNFATDTVNKLDTPTGRFASGLFNMLPSGFPESVYSAMDKSGATKTIAELSDKVGLTDNLSKTVGEKGLVNSLKDLNSKLKE